MIFYCYNKLIRKDDTGMPKETKPTTDKETPTEQKPEEATKPHRTKKSLVKVLLFVAVLALVGFASYTAARNKALAPNRPAEKALAALKANDSNAVYDLGSDDFKKASDRQKVKAVVEQWSNIVSQATEGEPVLVSKTSTTEGDKQLTNLTYKYRIKEGKSKINQKELFVLVKTQKVGNDYKLYTFSIDANSKQPDQKK